MSTMLNDKTTNYKTLETELSLSVSVCKCVFFSTCKMFLQMARL